MSKYIISRVKPAIGFTIDIIDGIQIGRRIVDVKPSTEFLNVFAVRFEGSDSYVWVLYLQRLVDVA